MSYSDDIFYLNFWQQAGEEDGLYPVRIVVTYPAVVLEKPEEWRLWVTSFQGGTYGLGGGNAIKDYRRGVVATPTLPVFGDIDSTAQRPLLTDMMIDTDGIAPEDIMVQTLEPYNPRYYRLHGGIPIQTIIIEMYAAKDDNVLVPWMLKTDTANNIRESARIKVGFIRVGARVGSM